MWQSALQETLKDKDYWHTIFAPYRTHGNGLSKAKKRSRKAQRAARKRNRNYA